MIQKQLLNNNLRFCRILAKQKNPIDKDWQNTQNFPYNSQILNDWITKGNNYGVVCGHGDLLVVDFDDKEFEDKFGIFLPETLTVTTGSGGTHRYFICDDPVSFKILDHNKKTLADIQGRGKQVVAPGSTHPNGNKYYVSKDLPIAALKIARLKMIFSDFLDEKHQYKPRKKDDDICNEIKNKVSLSSVLLKYGYDISNRLTMCGLGHSSKGGKCFSWNESAGLWYCFHCEAGGDVFSLVMEHEKCTFPQAKEILAQIAGINLKEETKKQKIELATNFYYDIRDYQNNCLLFYETQPFFYDRSGLFWLWNFDRCCYMIIDEIDLMNSFDKVLNFTGLTIRAGVKNNYIESLKRLGRDNIPKEFKKEWIQFKDKIYDFKNKKMFNSCPDYFTCNPIPYEIGTEEDTPTMDKLFEEWVGEEYVQTLYEIIAYCCTSCYPIHLIFGFIGSGRNGKSKFQGVLQKFLGKDNISSASLDKIASPNQRFESVKLYKKLCCFMSETNFQTMENTATLKMLSGGDLIDFEFKNKNGFNDFNYAKIVISSNSLPTSSDTSDGFYRRWLIIGFPNEFPEGKDILETIPEIEYSNLARKVVNILPALMENGVFTNQGTIEERQHRYILASNPLEIFLNECCIKDEKLYIKKMDLYNAYCKYLRLIKARVVKRKEFDVALNDQGYYVQNTRRRVKKQFIDTFREDDLYEYENGWWVDGLDLKPVIATETTIATNFLSSSIMKNNIRDRKTVAAMANVAIPPEIDQFFTQTKNSYILDNNIEEEYIDDDNTKQ